jgi:hypothetical protein
METFLRALLLEIAAILAQLAIMQLIKWLRQPSQAPDSRPRLAGVA